MPALTRRRRFVLPLLAATAVSVALTAPADAGVPSRLKDSLAHRVMQVPDAPPPRAAKSAADCNGIPAVSNQDPACQETRWVYGGWCLNDEVGRLFRLQDDPCLAACAAQSGQVLIEAAHVDMRVVAGNCPENQYPYTTPPFQAQFIVYTPDPAMGTPSCPVPDTRPAHLSVVVTVPSRTVLSPGDPAHFFQVTFPLGGCVPLGSVFGAFKWIDMPDDALVTDCLQNGTATCAWRLPGLLTLNGRFDQTPCAACCATYFRNGEVYGPDWSETCAEFSLLGDFGFYLDATACLWGTP